MAERRSSLSVIASLVICLLLLAAMFWLQYRVDVQEKPVAAGQIELVSSEAEADQPELLLASLEKRLSTAPLSQPDLNLYYSLKAKSGADESALDPIRELVGELGWRSTPAQQNLVYHALETRDFETMIMRADAILRRNKLTDEIIALLHLVETEPEIQPLLVRQLSLDPLWRKQFLGQQNALAAEAQLDGRYRTLMTMLDQGEPVARNEMAPALWAMVDGGRPDLAWELSRRFEPEGKDNILFDSDFNRLATSRNIDGYRPFPFDWVEHSKRGLQVDAVETVGNAELRIRWNGRGTPAMLSQNLSIASGGIYSLKVGGVNPRDDIEDKLSFSLICPAQTVEFHSGTYDAKKSELTLVANQPVNCSYPQFEVSGRTGDISRSRELNLSFNYFQMVE